MTDRPADWAARRQAWESERLDPAIDRAKERRSRFVTMGDIPVERLYGPIHYRILLHLGPYSRSSIRSLVTETLGPLQAAAS